MNVKLKKMIPTILSVLLALPMILAGVAKLAGTPELHQSFEVMELPTWFGYFIGLCELAGGIGLLIPRLSALAAIALMPIMLGAAYFHIAYDVPSALPALIFTFLATIIASLRMKEGFWISRT
ncbi:MAG: DoxX family protein [Psychrobium sp.]